MSSRCAVVPVNPRKGVPSVRIVPPPGSPASEEAIEAAWRTLCAENPRLHDGPLLAFVGFDGIASEVQACRSTYRLLAVTPLAETGVVGLGVTAVVVRDGRVLLGKRAAQTRMYGGLWEIGPSGGVGEVEDLREALREEVREEAGVEVVSAAAIAVVHDPVARTVDVACLVTVDGEVGTGSWEYDAVGWLGQTELERMADAGELSPPTEAMVRSGVLAESAGVRLD